MEGTLYSRQGAERLKRRVTEGGSERGQRLAGALFHQLNKLHSVDFFPDYDLEHLLLQQKKFELEKIKHFDKLPDGLISFSPSGASACGRGLYFKGKKAQKDEIQKYPYQRRWTRNSSMVHEAVQRDLLYCEKILKNPVFKVHRLESGLPAWEQNIKKHLIIEHKGVKFVLNGMCDGILEYQPEDGKLIGFEFKTKSTTIASVGTYKMKDVSPDHRLQCVAYSILFGIDEFIICYESVAKDGWTKGEEARSDIRTFYVKVTEQDRQALLDKYAEIAKQYYEGKTPKKEQDKCFFCVYKNICQEVGE